MWQFLFSFSGTLTAILTVLGAVWAFVVFSGKTAVEQWLKRNYKAWELEAERSYKEDFKRFENKLDGLAKQNEIKLDYLHPVRAKAADEIYALCLNIQQAAMTIILDNILDDKENVTIDTEKLYDSYEALPNLLVKLNQMTARNSFVGTGLISATTKLATFVTEVITTGLDAEKRTMGQFLSRLFAAIENIKKAYHSVLGVDD